MSGQVRKVRNKILNAYFKHPILFDVAIAAAFIAFIYYKQDIFAFKKITDNIQNVVSNIISTIVSFAGFILASLTVIVTVKANIKSKPEQSANAMELLLLSTGNYKKIISVFRDAIVELVLCLAILYVLWLPVIGLTVQHLLYLSIYGISVILLTLVRTLYILFDLIFKEFISD